MYNIDYFIEKFEAIPEDKWGMVDLIDENTGRSCALGHCGLRDYKEPTDEATALIHIFAENREPLSYKGELMFEYVYDVNDTGFDVELAKRNILNKLQELKAKEV